MCFDLRDSDDDDDNARTLPDFSVEPYRCFKFTQSDMIDEEHRRIIIFPLRNAVFLLNPNNWKMEELK